MIQPSILIVEDEAVVAEDLAQKITALGYRVLDIASTGEAALQISQAHPPSLILLDIQLTGKLDGIETATRVKESSDIPFIFLTAHSDPETVKRASAAGACGYVLKPFRERDLEVQLQAALYMSERKQTEQKLKKTEDLLLRAQRGAQAGVWEIDLRTDRITWSEPYYDLFGIDRSTEPSVAAWLSCIHAEDREQVRASYRQSLEEKRNQSMEFRIVKPNGEIRWIHRQGQVEVDEEGKAIRINGISFDITERKRAEEVLRKSEDRYRRLYESIDEGFCIIQVVFDANNRAVDYVFLEVNPSFEKQTGIQDAQGRSMRQIAPHHEEHWFEMYGHIALTGQSKRFEYPAVELHRWYQGYAYRIGDESERKVAIIFNDITERKRAEEAVKAIALFPSQNPSPVLRVSAAGILLYMNEVSHQLLRDLDLRVGQPVPIILENLVRNALKAAKSQQQEYALGSCHYLITVTPVAEGNYANFYWTDITDRKRAEAAVLESEQRLQHWNEQLEERVAERTQALVQSQERLRALATELNLAEQRERKHLAADLHDHLQQLLVLGKLKLAQLKRVSEFSPAWANMIAETDKALTEALSYTRTLVAELSPPVLRDQGLSAGLKWLEEYMRKYHLDVTVQVSHDHISVADDQALLLFQSVRELLINCSKYAETSEAWVHATVATNQLVIEVMDKGKGFALDSNGSANVPTELSSKFGLLSIRERMHALGGSFQITSSPGHGTTAVLKLPFSQAKGSIQVSGTGETSSEA